MIATHRKVEPLGSRKDATLDFTNAAPVDVGGVGVMFIAGDDTAFATNALCHVEMEAVLFAFARQSIKQREGERGHVPPFEVVQSG